MEKGRQQRRSCTSSGREGIKTAAGGKKKDLGESQRYFQREFLENFQLVFFPI